MISRMFGGPWNFMVFSLMLIFMGLFYQVAWQYPVIDSFPLIERLLDPNYLSQDFYTNTFSEFSPRLMVSKAIASISTVTGIDYQIIIAYSNIVRIWLYGFGLYLLFLSLTDHITALTAFTLSALSFLSMPMLPAWWPVTYDLTSSNIALVAAMYAWVYSIKGQVKIAFIFLSLTVFIHPVVGIHAFLISILLFITLYRWQGFIDLFKQLSVYPFAALYAAAFLFNYLSYQQVLPDQDFVAINGHFRHGHHFLFSHMEIEKWLSTLLMTGLAITACLVLKKPSSKTVTSISLVVITYSIILILLSYIFADLYPTRTMTSLIPMRAFPIIVPIIVLTIARLAVWYWQQGRIINYLLLFLPFLPYNQVGLSWFLLPNQHEAVLAIIITLIVLVALIIDQYSHYNFSHLNTLLLNSLPNIQYSTCLLPIALCAVILALVKFEIEIPTLKNSKEIYQWLTVNTKADEVVVSELNAANNQKIRLIARRAVAVSKDFPFNEKFYQQWYQRYSEVYIHKDKARGRIDALSADELNLLLDKYRTKILIRTKKLNSNQHFSYIGEVQGEESTAYIYRNKLMVSL